MRGPPSVFISYASQDREAARRIRDALLAAGIEAWYDENELGGGDVWDQKIRRQIRECVYFLPIISANTEARVEGYFRREWRLAAERTLDMADDVAFLVPVVIDGTSQDQARVPEKFLASQWMKVPGGEANVPFTAWCARVSANEPPPLPRSARSTAAPAGAHRAATSAVVLPFPPFPHHTPGQSVKYAAEIGLWTVHAAVATYKHSPKWVRALAIAWIVVLFVKSCSSDSGNAPRDATTHASVPAPDRALTPEQRKKAQAMAQRIAGAEGVGDLVRELTKQFGDQHHAQPALFLEGFASPPGDRPAADLANSVFSALYGTLAIEQPSQILLDKDSSAAGNAATALEHARVQDARYLLAGIVSGGEKEKALIVTVTDVQTGAVYWTHSYPAEKAVATEVAKDIHSHLPALTIAP
jgi:hypothetical protein